VTDAELVDRARRGDSTAFSELVDRHRSAVYRAALAAVGSPADADDVAQDAFVKAYWRLDGFRGEASFKTWLLTITWRLAINRRRGITRWLRRTRPAVRDEADADGALDIESGARSPEQQLGDRTLRQAIVAEIRALPPKLRDVLLLAQSGEYSYEQIGAMVKAPVGTVKWRVSEARRVVKLRLHNRGYTDV